MLSFSKGERFEILESDRSSNKSWWGVRSLRDDRIGYVPSKYMQVRNVQDSSHVFLEIHGIPQDPPVNPRRTTSEIFKDQTNEWFPDKSSLLSVIVHTTMQTFHAHSHSA